MFGKNRKKPLTDEELQYLAEHLDEISDVSEDLELSDVDSLDDPEYYPDDISERSDEQELPDSKEPDGNSSDVEEQIESEMEKEVLSSAPGSSKSKKKGVEMKWKNKNLILNEAQLCFRGNDSLPNSLLEISTPYECFQHFFLMIY